jgi:hypothetical protein
MSNANATHILTTVFTTLAGVVITTFLRIALTRYLIARRARRRQAMLTPHNKPGPGEEQARPTFFDVWEDGQIGSKEGRWSEIIVRYFR